MWNLGAKCIVTDMGSNIVSIRRGWSLEALVLPHQKWRSVWHVRLQEPTSSPQPFTHHHHHGPPCPSRSTQPVTTSSYTTQPGGNVPRGSCKCVNAMPTGQANSVQAPNDGQEQLLPLSAITKCPAANGSADPAGPRTGVSIGWQDRTPG